MAAIRRNSMALDDSAAVVQPTATVRKRTVVAAASLYFAIVFVVGLALGPIRVLYLEPWLGQTLAVLCETPFLLAAMGFAGRWAPTWTKLPPTFLSLLGVGVVALILQQVADLAVGFGLRGMTLSAQLAFFTTPPGWIYAFDLVAFALAPLIMTWSRRGHASGG